MTSTSSSAQKTDQLLQQTRLHFPRFEEAKVEITPIEKGGSDRRFYRVRSSPEHSLILVKYNAERVENRHYVQIAEFLATNGIRAPKVYFHDAEERLIWVEDLGEEDLWMHRNASWAKRSALYESALEQVAKLHALPISAADGLRNVLPAEFDAALYLWEQHYFFEHCLGRHFAVSAGLIAELSALPVLAETAERLANMPRVLVHRDFQSQNIIIREGEAYLIDFQGMRPGLSKYDIASLLYDPYVEITENERVELFEIYRNIRQRNGNPLRIDDEQVFRLCAMQRLMQALGAYGYLGLVKGNKAFLAHIPRALAALRTVVAQVEGAEKLHEALQHLSQRAA